MLGDLRELVLIVRLVFQVGLAHEIRPLDQIVAQIDIAGFREARFFRHKSTRRMLAPDQANKLGELRVIGKAVDIRNLGDNARGDDGTQTWDGEQGIGNAFHALGNLAVKSALEFFQIADMRPRDWEHTGQGGVEVWRHRE